MSPTKKNPLSIINRDKAANLKDLMSVVPAQARIVASPSPKRKIAEDTDVQNLLDSLNPGRDNTPRSGAKGGELAESTNIIGLPQVGMPRCQGYMYKQGHHWHSWKRRWFVLRLSGLEYYRRRVKFGHEIQSRPQGIVPLERVTALQRDVGKFPQPFCFQLVIAGEDRLLAVQCENKVNMEMWIDEINGAIRVATYGTEDDHQLLKKRLQRKAIAAGALKPRSPKKNKGMRIYGEDSKTDDGPKGKGAGRDEPAPRRPIVKPAVSGNKDLGNVKSSGAVKPRGALPRGPREGKTAAAGSKPPPRVLPSDPIPRGAIPRGAAASSARGFASEKRITPPTASATKTKKTETKKTETKKTEEEDKRTSTSSLPLASSIPLPPPRATDPIAPMFGPVLLQKDDHGNVVPQSVEEAMSTVECIGLFFGGAWQQDSIDFTPLLASWYSRARQSGHHLEIVYVSNDESLHAFNDYYIYSMPFLAVPFENKAIRLSLREMLNVKSVPTLVFVDRLGRPVLSVQDGAGDRVVDEDPDADKLMRTVHEMMKSGPLRSPVSVGVGQNVNSNYVPSTAITLSSGVGSPGGLTPGNDLPFFSSGMVAHGPANASPSAPSSFSGNKGSTDIHDLRAMDIMSTRSGSILAHENSHGGSLYEKVAGRRMGPAGTRGVNYGTYSSHLESDLRAARERNEAVSRGPLRRSNGPIVPVHVPHQIIKRPDRRAARHPELRKRLIEEQLKRPKITARKLAQFVLWLNSLEVWPVPITDIYQEMRNGLMLCNLMMALIPGLKIRGLNGRPRTRGPALRNTEKALMAMWQHCQPNARRMPSAAEICEGKSERIGWLIAEIFDIFVMRDMRTARRCLPMMKWYAGILSHYGITLSARTMAAPFRGRSFQQASWADFRNGVALSCVLHYFCGARGNAAMGLMGMDLARVRFHPRHAKHYHDNIAVVFETLLRMRMPLIWTVDNFIAFPDSDFLIWQLHCIYLMFRDMDCGLPFVENEQIHMEREPVVTVDGRTGIAHVVNLRFLDSAEFSATPAAFIDNELVGRTARSNPLRGVAPGGEIDRRLASQVTVPAVAHAQIHDPFGALDSPIRPSNLDLGPVLSPVDILFGKNPSHANTAEPVGEEGERKEEIVWDHLAEKNAKSDGNSHAEEDNVDPLAVKKLQKQRHGRVHSIAGAGGDTVVVTSKKVELPPTLPPPPAPPAHSIPPIPPAPSAPPAPYSANSNPTASLPPGSSGQKVAPLASLSSAQSSATFPPVDERAHTKQQIKNLQEERMEIEALSEQLTSSKPEGVQAMLDACRLTELRLMCIEEERRLTELLVTMPETEKQNMDEKVSSMPKKRITNNPPPGRGLTASPPRAHSASASLPPGPSLRPRPRGVGRGSPPPRPPGVGRGAPPPRPPGEGRGAPPPSPSPRPRPRGVSRGELLVPKLPRPPPSPI